MSLVNCEKVNVFNLKKKRGGVRKKCNEYMQLLILPGKQKTKTNKQTKKPKKKPLLRS